MQKNGVILLIILLCVAFMVSCGKKETAKNTQGELVRTETEGIMPSVFFCQSVDHWHQDWYNNKIRG